MSKLPETNRFIVTMDFAGDIEELRALLKAGQSNQINGYEEMIDFWVVDAQEVAQ